MEIVIDPSSRKVLLNLEKAPLRAKQGVRYGLFQLGKALTETATKGISNEPKTGRVYKYQGRTIRASAPGEYPARRSGSLRKSINFEVRGFDEMEFGSEGDLAYPKFLEGGTKFMKQRPTLLKSIKQNRKNTEKNIGEKINKEITRQ